MSLMHRENSAKRPHQHVPGNWVCIFLWPYGHRPSCSFAAQPSRFGRLWWSCNWLNEWKHFNPLRRLRPLRLIRFFNLFIYLFKIQHLVPSGKSWQRCQSCFNFWCWQQLSHEADSSLLLTSFVLLGSSGGFVCLFLKSTLHWALKKS